MIYCYYVSRGLVSLHKLKTCRDDADTQPKKIGKFKNDNDAKDACLKHYEKSCVMARAAGRPEPAILWM